MDFKKGDRVETVDGYVGLIDHKVGDKYMVVAEGFEASYYFSEIASVPPGWTAVPRHRVGDIVYDPGGSKCGVISVSVEASRVVYKVEYVEGDETTVCVYDNACLRKV